MKHLWLKFRQKYKQKNWSVKKQTMATRNSQTLMQTSGDDTFDFLFKIVLIGDCSVGKTKIVQRFKTGNYTESHANTIGVDFSMKTITVDGKKVKVEYTENYSIQLNSISAIRFCGVYNGTPTQIFNRQLWSLFDGIKSFIFGTKPC